MGKYTRLLRLRADPPATFFLWGPRQSGKSTLIGAEFPEVPWVDLLLPAYRRRPRRRVVAAPKFYFGDVGLVNFLARRGALQPGGELFGKAFENWVFHELCCYNAYRARYADFFYWRLSSGIEVDPQGKMRPYRAVAESGGQ